MIIGKKKNLEILRFLIITLHFSSTEKNNQFLDASFFQNFLILLYS